MKEVLQGLFGDVVTEENLLEFGRLFVSRAAFERLQREAAADLALWQAGAKNLTAAKALLAWQDVDLQAADWQERLAEQVRDMWGGGGIGISGPSHQAARSWYEKQNMPVIADSSLGRGLFSGRVKSGKPEAASEVMDEFAMKGYACPDNFERLRRCEEVAGKLGLGVPQIAMAWLFRQKLNAFAVVSTGKPERMLENIEALHLVLDEKTLRYLDLQEGSDR